MSESTGTSSLSKRKANIVHELPPLKAPKADHEEVLHLIAKDGKSMEPKLYVLDVKHGKLITSVKIPDYVPFAATAVTCHNRLYILAGMDFMLANLSSNRVLCFDLDHLAENGWTNNPSMSHERFHPNVVAFNGKIYAFGGTKRHFGEVFDIIQGSWADLKPPSEADSCFVSFPVIVNSSRSQILVHIGSSKSLHAYNVADESWECVDKNYGDWCENLVAVDGVLYSLVLDDEDYYTVSDKGCSLRAYDLDEKKEVHILNFITADEVRMTYRCHLYHLGNHKFCLAGYDSNEKCFVYIKFIMFKGESSGKIFVLRDPADHLQSFELDVCCLMYM